MVVKRKVGKMEMKPRDEEQIRGMPAEFISIPQSTQQAAASGQLGEQLG